MTDGMTEITEADLIAYAEGKIAANRRALVADHIARNPEAAETVAAFREQTRTLKSALDPVLDEPVPLRLLAVARRGRGPSWPSLAVAASLLFAIGLGAGWTGRAALDGSALESGLGQRAVLAHTVFASSLAPILDQTADAIEENGWLSATLGRPTPTPMLDEAGFALIGGRLMMGETHPAALLIFRDQEDRRVSLYLRSDVDNAGQTPMRHISGEKSNSVAWSDGPNGAAVTGDLPLAELEAVARTIRQQLLA